MKHIAVYSRVLAVFLQCEEGSIIDSVVYISMVKPITDEEFQLIQEYHDIVVKEGDDISVDLWNEIRGMIVKYGLAMPTSVTTHSHRGGNAYNDYEGPGDGGFWSIKKFGKSKIAERIARRLVARTNYWAKAVDKYQKMSREEPTQEVTEDAKMLNKVMRDNRELKERLAAVEESLELIADHIIRDKKPELKLVVDSDVQG